MGHAPRTKGYNRRNVRLYRGLNVTRPTANRGYDRAYMSVSITPKSARRSKHVSVTPLHLLAVNCRLGRFGSAALSFFQREGLQSYLTNTRCRTKYFTSVEVLTIM